MKREVMDFQPTQPLGLVPKVDVLLDPRPAGLSPQRRSAWRRVGTGLDFLRDLLTYRFG